MTVFDMLKGGSGDVEDFTEADPYTDIARSGGRRRRKSLRRKGARKGVRKGTHKRARKHYGGYSQKKQQQGGEDDDRRKVLEDKAADGALTDEETAELEQIRIRRRKVLEDKEAAGTLTDEEKIELEQIRNSSGGGSRRRKSRHNKKTHSKKTRGKKTSPWIKHVLQFAKDNKMKYFQALKDKRCRAAYKSSK